MDTGMPGFIPEPAPKKPKRGNRHNERPKLPEEKSEDKNSLPDDAPDNEG